MLKPLAYCVVLLLLGTLLQRVVERWDSNVEKRLMELVYGTPAFRRFNLLHTILSVIGGVLVFFNSALVVLIGLSVVALIIKWLE